MTWNEQDILYRLQKVAEELTQAIMLLDIQNEAMALGEQAMRQGGATEDEVAVYLSEYVKAMQDRH